MSQNPNSIPVRRDRVGDRKGRCYELCGKGLVFGKHADGWTLVHGELRRGCVSYPYHHAWLISPDGESVYDAVLDKYMPRAEYEALCDPAEHCRYGLTEALAMVLRNKTWGPWHDVTEQSEAA